MRNTLIVVLIFSVTGFLPFEVLSESQEIDQNSQAVSVVPLRDDVTSTRLSVEVNDLTIRDVLIEKGNQTGFNNEQYCKRARVGSEPTTTREGWSELPVIARLVRIPPTADIQLKIHEVSSHIENDYIPFIVACLNEDSASETSGIPSEEFQNYDGFYPPEPVVIGEPAILRGHRLVRVTIYPMQYNPATRQCKINDQVDFELEYGGVGANIVVNPDRPRPSSSIQRILESLVVNPPLHRDGGVAGADRGSYLLIYPRVNEIEDALYPLIEWRARQGWETHAIEVQNGASTNQVKEIIQEAYDEWDNPPEMVVLVGDASGNVAISAYNPTDLDYVLLDGRDILADADIGRISVESVDRLRQVVRKIVSYETDPWMDEPHWYESGMVCEYGRAGLSTILLTSWLAREMVEKGLNEVHEYYSNAPYMGMSVNEFFESEFRRGVLFSSYRGNGGMRISTGEIMSLRAHQCYPAVTTITCFTGDYIGGFSYSEAFLRSEGGAIGAAGMCTGGTRVQYNNALMTGTWAGILKEGFHNFGTAVNRGRYELYRQYDGYDGGGDNHSRWYNLMGDPATHLFTGVPRTIITTHDETLPLGANRFSVRVDDDEEEVGLPDALVCLYKPDDEFQQLARTDESGTAEFYFPSDALTEGELMVTVTMHNVVPSLSDVIIEEAEYYLGAESWTIDDNDRGDGNGIANPGEIVELIIELANYGTRIPGGNVTVTAESLSPYAEVISDPVEMNGAPDVGDAVEVAFIVEIADNTPDCHNILIGIEAATGEMSWNSVAAIQVEAARLVITDLIFEDDELGRGQLQTLDIEVTNEGQKRISEFHAHLSSNSPMVTIPQPDADYEGFEPDETGYVDGELFLIRSHPFAVPGMEIEFTLTIESEDGFHGTISYSFNLSEPEDTDPFGPDEYGYVCFDSGDEGWEIAPVYDWIEIDPDEDNNDFDGELLNLRDQGNESDQSEVVFLPFDFQYYGEEFDQLTVCSNGWAAFGDWRELCDFRNRHIASGGGPDAQLCVFWDNLLTGRILTFYHEDAGRFIVEWNDMSRLGGNETETFQLILYDPAIHPTFTGDGLIEYQYKEVTNGRSAPRNETPYCTIGIGNLDDTDGLEYTYWNDYHAGAKRIENEMTIKFTTAIQYITGVLNGTVRDAETGDLISDARVITSRGFCVLSDSVGVYTIPDILVGDGYIITVSAQGYNDSTKYGANGDGFSIVEGETLTVDFDLLHPEFNVDTEGFLLRMNPDDSLGCGFTLSNDGNGTLGYGSRFTYVLDEEGESPPEEGGGAGRDDADDLWDPLLVWAAGDSVDDTKLNGIAFVEDRWIVSGGGSGRYEENWFHVFDRWGNYQERFPQPIDSSRYGLRNIDYYNGFLYCAYPEGNAILKVDPDNGQEVARMSLPGQLATPTNLMVDADGYIWASSITTDLYRYEVVDDTTLVQRQSFRMYDPRFEGERVRQYGISWFRDDPDGHEVYIISNKPPVSDPDDVLPNMSLYKMNPRNGDVMFLTNLPAFDNACSGRSGLHITPKWNNLVWAMAVVADNPNNDIIGVIELAPNSSWIDYSPRSDTLLSGDSQRIRLSITTAGVDTGRYGVVIQFSHNARGGITNIPVDLTVTTVDAHFVGLTHPLEYTLGQNYPNPFNPTTEITYSLTDAGYTEVTVFDLLGHEVLTLVDEHLSAGRYRVSFDGSRLPSGIYIYRLRSKNFTAVRKMALVK